MKKFYFVLVLFFTLIFNAQAQLPYKAAAGASAALRKAASDSLKNAAITAIVTLGDTSGIGGVIPEQYRSLINLNFNSTNGTNSMWFYAVKGKVDVKDSSNIYAMLNIPLLGFIGIAIPAGSLPDTAGSPIGGSEPLPATFMDSDVMCQKVKANSTFQTYLTTNPTAKFQLTALGVARAGGADPAGPLWVATIGVGSFFSQTGSSVCVCRVPATDNSGVAVCTAVPLSSVETVEQSEIVLSPNPASDELRLHIPLEKYSPQVSMDIYNSLGEHIRSYPMHEVAGGMDISLPVDGIANGSYFLRYSGLHTHYIPFSIQR